MASVINSNVPSLEVESGRDFIVSKRPGVGRGIILQIEGSAIELAGDSWSAFMSHFYGTLAQNSIEDYRANPETEYAVAYDFTDHFTGKELSAIKDFVNEHSLR